MRTRKTALLQRNECHCTGGWWGDGPLSAQTPRTGMAFSWNQQGIALGPGHQSVERFSRQTCSSSSCSPSLSWGDERGNARATVKTRGPTTRGYLIRLLHYPGTLYCCLSPRTICRVCRRVDDQLFCFGNRSRHLDWFAEATFGAV